jgi:hypothetical protein
MYVIKDEFVHFKLWTKQKWYGVFYIKKVSDPYDYSGSGSDGIQSRSISSQNQSWSQKMIGKKKYERILILKSDLSYQLKKPKLEEQNYGFYVSDVNSRNGSKR